MNSKLIVSELDVRGRYVTREAYHIMKELIDVYGWKHIETNALRSRQRSIDDQIRDKCGALPDVILFWEGFHVAGVAVLQLRVRKSGCRTVVYCHDLHSFGELRRAEKMCALASCELILAAYAPVFDRFFPEIAKVKRVVWVPNSASPEFLLPINREAENAVLLSGVVSDHYPLRLRLATIAEQSNLNIVVQKHPGYRCVHDHKTSDVVGAGFARRINRCRAAFTDATKLNYVLRKYFEIPACGALLVGDVSVQEELAELGFKEWEHYVPVSNQDLEHQIRYILDESNHDALDEVRKRGQELVWERHKTSDRARLIDEVCVAT